MKKRVGILRGGNKEHYENSIKKGGEIILHIYENLSDKWKPVDVLVDGNGIWHVDGIPIMPAELVNKVDLVWNTTHPNFSVILKSFDIPNIGIDAFPFLLSQNRSILQEHMNGIGIKMPRHFVIPAYQADFDGSLDKFILKKAREVHEKFSPPWVIKSLTNEIDIVTHVANTYPELINAIEDITTHGKSILIEELIVGKDVSMYSVKGFRGEEIYNLPPVLYKGGNIIAPWNFTNTEREKLNEISKVVFNHLNISDYLNSYFVIHPRRGIFLRSIDFHPDVKQDSHFNQAALYIGA